jgi:adenine-specific DNA-methyltransferase
VGQNHADPHRRKEFKQTFAKRQRAEATDLERKLWSCLRNGQINGLRFRRQQPIGPYVADFYCSAAKLVVELDGSQHGAENNRKHDLRRTSFMNLQGYRVLRFTNHDRLHDCEAVLDSIVRAVDSRT